jgi:bacteriorhodopsin
VLTCAMVSYLVMATGMGISFVPIHGNYGNPDDAMYKFYREVYYARMSRLNLSI